MTTGSNTPGRVERVTRKGGRVPKMLPHSEIVSWATWLRAAGRPETTIGLRTYHVSRVMAELDGDPFTVTTEQLVHYLGAQAWSLETRRSYRASLRVFYAWAQATGRRPDNPAALLPVIKLPRAMPRPIPEAMYQQSLRGADADVRFMILLAAHAGLRRGEIARARREDLVPDLFNGSLRVLGKGGHQRMVPLSTELERLIRTAPPGWLFPSPAPDRSGMHVTAGHVGVVVSRALPDGWSCHTLRHRCATIAYQVTRDLRAVQELLGHAKPETTARYTMVPIDAMRACVDAAAA